MASVALAKMHHQIEKFKSATKNAREKAGEVTEAVLTLAETGGASFAFGFYEGSIADPTKFEFFGVPAPLLTGIAAHVFALIGVGKGMEPHIRAIGNGALAAHLNGIGRQMGTKRKNALTARATTQGDDGPGEISGRRGVGSDYGVSEEALRDLAAR
jgi:hypothetical protein